MRKWQWVVVRKCEDWVDSEESNKKLISAKIDKNEGISNWSFDKSLSLIKVGRRKTERKRQLRKFRIQIVTKSIEFFQ